MSYLKQGIIVFIILSSSFVWGFKRDSIRSRFDKLWEDSATKIEETKPEENAAPDGTRDLEQTEATVPPAVDPAINNPYQQFLNSNKQAKPKDSLSETLDSIRPNKIDDKKQIQKNAYFEKLSEQLKELRGENTKQASSAAQEPPPPYPPSPYPSSAYPVSPYPPSTQLPTWDGQQQPYQAQPYPPSNYPQSLYPQQPPYADYQQMMQNQEAAPADPYMVPAPYEAPAYHQGQVEEGE